MNNFNEKRMAYSSLPHKNMLRCIICEINFMKIRDFPIKSSYHWQIFKCRAIIQTIREVIASPILGTTGSIYIIATSELIESCELKTQLSSLDVLCGKSQPVTDDIYIMCLNYTIKCRIAPLWSKVGQYYVHGLEFNVTMKEFNALKVKITINDENAQFHFSATTIKIPFAHLEEFDLNNSLIAEFLADDNGILNLTKYCLSVHVLPSMKRGRIVSVFKKIPSYFPFKNYYQLRQYWIDMYDYYLPQTDKGIIYYEIEFLPGTSTFIYPSVCITTETSPLFSYTNTDDIISQFIYDLSGALSKICNKQLYIYENKEQGHQLIQLKNDAEKTYIQDRTLLTLPKNEELTLYSTADKISNDKSDNITQYECTTSINLCKSNDRTLLNAKKTKKSLVNQLEIYTNLMKLNRSKQINGISSNNSSIVITKMHDVKMKKAEVNENVTPFFKETSRHHMLHEFKKPLIKTNTSIRLTLKQKLSNAMDTTNL